MSVHNVDGCCIEAKCKVYAHPNTAVIRNVMLCNTLSKQMVPSTIICRKDHAQLPLLPLIVWQPAGGVQDLTERTDTYSNGLV